MTTATAVIENGTPISMTITSEGPGVVLSTPDFDTFTPATGLPVVCKDCVFYMRTTRRARKHGRKWIVRWRCGNTVSTSLLMVRKEYDTCPLGVKPKAGGFNDGHQRSAVFAPTEKNRPARPPAGG